MGMLQARRHAKVLCPGRGGHSGPEALLGCESPPSGQRWSLGRARGLETAAQVFLPGFIGPSPVEQEGQARK